MIGQSMDCMSVVKDVVFPALFPISWVEAGNAAPHRKERTMTYLKLISTFAGLTSLLSLGSREAPPRNSRANAGRSRTAPQSRERADSPTWPPPDGVYWGM